MHTPRFIQIHQSDDRLLAAEAARGLQAPAIQARKPDHEVGTGYLITHRPARASERRIGS